MKITHRFRDGSTVRGDREHVARVVAIEENMRRQERNSVAELRAQGVKAAHPDDGWVNRERNTVRLEYPTFNDRPQVGDLIALGWPWRGYRLVRVTALDHSVSPKFAPMYGMSPGEPWRYSFEEVMHCDLLRNDWFGLKQTFIRRVDPDDPTIGAQVRSGWATYVALSEPHTMADCPYKEQG